MPDTFKDLLSPALVAQIARRVQKHHNNFDATAFQHQATDALETMALKARSRHIARALHAHLPDYPRGVQILLTLLDWDDPTYRGFHLMPIAQYVEDYGVDYLDESMHALYHITQKWTGEFAIRPLIRRYPAQVWQYLLRWRGDDNHHVRRLVSEGTRPRLPWATQLEHFIHDPTPLFDLLTPLMADTSDYVRRSVANNLNDISKDNAGHLMNFLQPYAQTDNPHTRWIIRHALRSRIKAADPATLTLLGYDAPRVQLQSLVLERDAISIGADLHFQCTFISTASHDQTLIIDYIIEYMKANGQQRPKVFKLSRRTLAPHESLTIDRRHSFKITTTRRLYAGEHRLALQINGVRMGEATFTLHIPPD